MMKLLTLLALLQLACLASAQCPWTQTGALYWSAASTWAPNPVPTTGSNVVLPSGKIVIYDITATGITYAGITVPEGSTLTFDGSKDVWMETKFINVLAGANFTIGSANCRYTTKATITLFGARDITTNVVPFLGNKGIFVQGLLEWYGTPPQPTWTNVASTVKVNATSFTVKDTIVNWKVGDQITLASTDYYKELTERFTITAISGKIITVDKKTKYLHWGADNQFAEVGAITRNIVVQGDASSEASTFGGHCIVTTPGIAHVYGVEFSRMGQAEVLARYPFHFHFMGDQIGKGHFVNESSFHDNYQRCLTIHGTSGVMIKNNVGFNVTGHCYFLEEGSETRNVFDHNLGMTVNVGKMIYSDKKPSIFWITNPNNTFINNVAVGGSFGFWFSLPKNPIGMSSGQTHVFPRYTPLGQFDRNTAHSADSGIFFDNGPNELGNTDDGTSYTPLVGPYTTSTQTYNTAAVRATITGNNAYKCRQHGMWIRGSQITVTKSLLMDNGVGVNMPTTGNVFRDSTIIGETPNIGTPGFTQWFNDFGRSRPALWWASFPIQGFQGYDIAGGQFCRNVIFQNFVTDSVRRAGAVGAITNGIYVLPPNDMFAQITLTNANAFAIPDMAWGTPSNQYDGPNHVVMLDTDGTLTGNYGNVIASNNSIFQDPSGPCVSVDAWGKHFNCSRNTNGYSHIAVLNKNTAGSNFGSSLSWLYRAAFIPFGKNNVIDNVTGGDPRNAVRTMYSANLISRMGYLMKFYHNTPPQLQLNLRYASTGEWIVLALQYPPTTFTITRGYSKVALTPVTSLAQLTKLTYYYDATNQYLYVMYHEDNGNLASPASFPEYGYGESYVDILAGCGSNCAVSDRPVPAALPDTDEQYQVSLKGCTAGTTSSKDGIGYFKFNKNTHVATYIIYHNIPTATTAGIFVNGVLYQQLPVGQAPIRGAFELSWNKWNALWAGNMTVVVKSTAFPNGEIKGVLGCVGACTAPPSISGADHCASIPNENVIFRDSLNNTNGWTDWSGNITLFPRDFAHTADKRCGTASLKSSFGVWNSISLHHGNADCTRNGLGRPGAPACASWQYPYVSLTPYAYLQFNVKSPSGPLPTPFVIAARNSTDKPIGKSFTVTFPYIDNFVVEETWTRVKVPLAALGLQGNEYIGLFSIQLQSSLNNFPLLIDDYKLVPSYSEALNLAPQGSVRYWSAVTC